MKKWRFLLFGLSLMLLTTSSAKACDFCNFYLSIYPNDFQHSVGINYRYRSYKAYFVEAGTRSRRHFDPTSLVDNDGEGLVEETYRTMEVQGRYFIKPEFQLVFTLPYSFNNLAHNSNNLVDLSGPGDAITIGLYQLHNTMSDSSNFFRQRWSGGAGVKWPTGTFQEMDGEGELIDEHLQSGTGSFDAILLTEYLARMGRFGINASVSYRYNTENSNNFRFANRFNAYSNVFYAQRVGRWNLMPEVGLYYEQANRDQQNNSELANSGGTVLFGSVGATVFYRSFSISGRYQDPWSESLNDIQVPNFERVILGLTYYFR